MKTIVAGCLGLVLAAGVAADGMADTEAGRVEAAAKQSGWERVGEADAARQTPEPARTQAASEENLRARKAEMVRRMFWIVMAHR